MKENVKKQAMTQSAIIDTQTRMDGGIESLDQYDEETLNAAHTQMYDNILKNDELTDSQKLTQTVKLISEIPGRFFSTFCCS